MKCFIYVPHSYVTKFYYIFKIKLCFRKFSIANLKCFFRINIKSASVGASRTLVYEPGCRKHYLILDLRIVCQLNVTKSTEKCRNRKLLIMLPIRMKHHRGPTSRPYTWCSIMIDILDLTLHLYLHFLLSPVSLIIVWLNGRHDPHLVFVRKYLCTVLRISLPVSLRLGLLIMVDIRHATTVIFVSDICGEGRLAFTESYSPIL